MMFNKGVSGDEVAIFKSKDRISIYDVKYVWEKYHINGPYSKINNVEILSADGNFYPIYGINRYKNQISCMVKTNTSSIVIGDDGDLMVKSDVYGRGVKNVNQIDYDEVVVMNRIKLDYENEIYCEGLAYLAGLMFFNTGMHAYIPNSYSIIENINKILESYNGLFKVKVVSKTLPNLGSYCKLYVNTHDVRIKHILKKIHNIFPMINDESKIEFFAGLIDNYANVKSGIPYISVRDRTIANYLTTMAALAGIDVSYGMYKYQHGDKIRIGIFPNKELKNKVRDVIKKRKINSKHPIHLGNIQKAHIINVTGNYIDKYLFDISHDNVICSKYIVFV